MDWLFWLSAAALAMNAAMLGTVALGWRRVPMLADLPAELPPSAPRLSVIVPARNEAHTIEPALRSMMALDYPALEVIAIDDRSEDATGEIIDRLAREHPSLRAIHVRSLAPGWLGKNHALAEGAAQASGDYLLFTDADVHYESSALRRAVAYCEARALDHLTVFPEVPTRSRFIEMNMLGGFVGLLALYRPWRAERTGRHGLGVGAFNLVRASTYRKAGGHGAIAMDILDDIELGRLMGDHGGQALLNGATMVRVEIYRTSLEMIRGLQKNLFTFLRYSAVMLLAVTLAMFVVAVWPWIGVFVTDGVGRWLNLASIILVVAVYGVFAWLGRYSLLSLLYLPVTGLFTIGLYWQVAIRTWLQGGVVWRGTFYPLAELRRRKRP